MDDLRRFRPDFTSALSSICDERHVYRLARLRERIPVCIRQGCGDHGYLQGRHVSQRYLAPLLSIQLSHVIRRIKKKHTLSTFHSRLSLRYGLTQIGFN